MTRGEKVFVRPGPTNKSQPWMYGEEWNNPHQDPAWSRLQWDLFNKIMSKSGEQEWSQLKERPSRWTSLKLHPHTKQEQEMELQSTPSPANKCALCCSHTELESAAPQADKCGLHCSQRIRKLPSRFKDYVM